LRPEAQMLSLPKTRSELKMHKKATKRVLKGVLQRAPTLLRNLSCFATIMVSKTRNIEPARVPGQLEWLAKDQIAALSYCTAKI
jgi:hypothetical protein